MELSGKDGTVKKHPRSQNKASKAQIVAAVRLFIVFNTQFHYSSVHVITLLSSMAGSRTSNNTRHRLVTLLDHKTSR